MSRYAFYYSIFDVLHLFRWKALQWFTKCLNNKESINYKCTHVRDRRRRHPQTETGAALCWSRSSHALHQAHSTNTTRKHFITQAAIAATVTFSLNTFRKNWLQSFTEYFSFVCLYCEHVKVARWRKNVFIWISKKRNLVQVYKSHLMSWYSLVTMMIVIKLAW